MIYFCADDYGLNDISSMHIKQCVDEGALNKVSVFPNFENVGDLSENIRLSLHLNLVEGKCMANEGEIDLLADKDGNFKHTFGGLLKLNLFHGKKLEAQVYREIKAQVMAWKNMADIPFCVDSHQHTHMIPAVFNALLKVLDDEKISLEYMRIPREPILPYIKTPSLYFTYSPINIAKQWLLNFLWLINKQKRKDIPTAYFFGILFSGKMDEKRVSKILPKYIKMAEKNGRDVEVLFHPGYTDKCKDTVFNKFYLSENRKTEFDSVMKLKERSVL